jgi:hypothetical protein
VYCESTGLPSAYLRISSSPKLDFILLNVASFLPIPKGKSIFELELELELELSLVKYQTARMAKIKQEEEDQNFYSFVIF